MVTVCVAAAAVLATSAGLRLTGIAVLSRPRSPRGAAAREVTRPIRTILLTLTCVSLVIGILPGLFLWIMADPILRNLTGVEAAARSGPFGTGPGYLALPVAALMGACFAAVLAIRRWNHRESRVAGAWYDGAPLPHGLPFGDPLAQSAGEGFLPDIPIRLRLRRPTLRLWPHPRLTRSQIGFWLILAGAAACLTVLALGGSSG